MTDPVRDLCSLLDLGQKESEQTAELLQAYVELIRKWNPAINVIARSTVDNIWHRHILDSAQLYRFLPETGLWLDMGSGGGLPGIVLACLSKVARPGVKIKLVEADQRKAVFLRECCRQLALLAEVHTGRIETLGPQNADVISARALASLSDLLSMAHPHLVKGGVCVFLKGEKSEEEVLAARQMWSFDLTRTPSKTSDGASILEIRNLRHV